MFQDLEPPIDDDFRLVVDRAVIRLYAPPKFGDAYAVVFGPPDTDIRFWPRSDPE